MAKRHKKSRRTGKSGNSCCPVIRFHCPRAAGPKAAGLGGIFDSAEQVLARTRAAAKHASIKERKVMCTLAVGKMHRRVNLANIGAAVKRAAKAQVRRRCIPNVNGRTWKRI